MNKKTFSSLAITVLIVFGCASFSNAEQIVLCLSSIDQYVVAVGQDGECLEEETQIKIKGSSVSDLKTLTPVASFEHYEECDTEGTVTKIGLDKNGNYQLDENEILSIFSDCKVVADWDSNQ